MFINKNWKILTCIADLCHCKIKMWVFFEVRYWNTDSKERGSPHSRVPMMLKIRFVMKKVKYLWSNHVLVPHAIHACESIQCSYNYTSPHIFDDHAWVRSVYYTNAIENDERASNSNVLRLETSIASEQENFTLDLLVFFFYF